MKDVVGKEVRIKGHPAPSFKFGLFKVRYVQLAYDNRYFLIDRNDFGSHWTNMIKVPDRALAKPLIATLIDQMDHVKKEAEAHNKFIKFQEAVQAYDLVLDQNES